MLQAFLSAMSLNQISGDLKSIIGRQRCLLIAVSFFMTYLTITERVSLMESLNVLILLVHMLLLANQRLSSHGWGILSGLSYGILTLNTGNTTYALVQLLIYVPCCLVGPYYWINRMVDGKCIVRSIKDLSIERQILLHLTAMFFIIGGIFMQTIYGYGVLVTFAILGSIFNIVRIKEQWYLWILIAILGLSGALSKPLFLVNYIDSIILYSGLLMLGFYGHRNWNKSHEPMFP